MFAPKAQFYDDTKCSRVESSGGGEKTIESETESSATAAAAAAAEFYYDESKLNSRRKRKHQTIENDINFLSETVNCAQAIF